MENKASHKKVWDKTNSWGNELELLREIIVKTQLVETNKWGGEVYTYDGKNILGIGGFKNYFTIWFFNGVFLNDPKKVLVNAQEGVTKSLRQWRLYSKDKIDEKAILIYIAEAIENEKLGKKLAPAKRKRLFQIFFERNWNATPL